MHPSAAARSPQHLRCARIGAIKRTLGPHFDASMWFESCEAALIARRASLQARDSVVIFAAQPEAAGAAHRALLFKFLADASNVPCSFVGRQCRGASLRRSCRRRLLAAAVEVAAICRVLCCCRRPVVQARVVRLLRPC